ncbi:MAG: LPS export ABC transporter periplasmic protein LptC [Endomicrobia bacterium]|nr:LPS export ABC transporter periplasmic protein LptC [Endomicrobiia bacterium]
MELNLIKIFLCLSLIFLGCCDKITTKKAVNKNKTPINTNSSEALPTIKDFELIHSNKGKILWKIRASDAIVNPQKNIITIKNGHLELFQDRKRTAEMKFQLASYDTKDEIINFYGRNLITTIENEKIITYDIKYIHKENKIYSEKEIEIHKEGSIIKGVGFETYDGFQTIRIYKNVIEPE